jgi:hypothetical protein
MRAIIWWLYFRRGEAMNNPEGRSHMSDISLLTETAIAHHIVTCTSTQPQRPPTGTQTPMNPSMRSTIVSR